MFYYLLIKTEKYKNRHINCVEKKNNKKTCFLQKKITFAHFLSQTKLYKLCIGH